MFCLPVKELKLDLSPTLNDVKLKARIDVLNRVLEGNWNTVFKGQGLEFAGYRQYSYGDDASKIDWHASLRAHETLVRELEEYRNFNVFFLMDVSNSMLFSSTGKLKAEYSAELVHALSHSLLNGGDAIGLGMFTDKVVSKVSPSLGKGVFFRITHALMNPENYGGNKDIIKVLQYISTYLAERSVIIIISDFIGFTEGWNRYVNILSGKYDLIGIMVRDPRDFEMPDTGGQFLVEDPYNGKRMYIDSKQYAKRYSEFAQKEEAFVQASFEKAKQGFISLRTDEDYQDTLMKYFKKRMSLVR